MLLSEKRKISEMVVNEMRWMYEHTEYNVPEWYVNLLISAEQRLILHDYAGAAHDIKQAINARKRLV